MKAGAIAFVCGVVFAIGLGVAGMTRPTKVIAFLDVTGDWDPSLAFVMLGAILVFGGVHRLAVRRAAPVFSARFDLPSRTDVDGRLLLGATLFGLGWGLSGFCPGPAVTSLVSGTATSLLFVGSMLVGMAAHARLLGARAAPAPAAPAVGSAAAADG